MQKEALDINIFEVTIVKLQYSLETFRCNGSTEHTVELQNIESSTQS